MRNINPIFKLVPRVDSMAICTKNFKVALLSFPFLKATKPRPVAVFRPNFEGAVDVVNLKNTEIINPTRTTLTAKIFDKLFFLFPKPVFPVKRPIVFIPKRLLALTGTEAGGAWLSTILTNTILLPSSRIVASAATIFPHSLFNIPRVGFKMFATRMAYCVNLIRLCGFHVKTILHILDIIKPIYCKTNNFRYLWSV